MLTTLTQSQLVAIQAAAIQAGASGLQDLSEGAILLAWAQASGEVGLWLQAQTLQISLLTRAATSSGSDLDSWMADFEFTRLQAVAAKGQETFRRFSSGSQVVVAVGATVETSDGTQSFTVIADTGNPAYNAGIGGYPMASNATSVTATIQAQTAGTGGNVAPGTVTTISGAIPGVDACTNVTGFTSGSNAETDTAFRSRFVTWLNSLAEGTPDAVEAAVASVQTNLDYELVENQSYAGQEQAGYFYIVVDDGTGSPSSELLSSIHAAVDAVRPLTSQFNIFGPSLVEITVTMTISGQANDVSLVQTALQNYINTAGLAGSVLYSKLDQLAYNASPTVTNVQNVLLSGGTADVTCTVQQRPIVSTVTVTRS